MTFHEGGQFSGGRVRRSRGASGGAPGRGPGRGGVAIGGGGLLVLAVILIAQLSGVDVSQFLGTGEPGPVVTQQGPDEWVPACSAEEANVDRECRLNGTVQSLDVFWFDELAAQGQTLDLPDVTSFTGSVNTACGHATSAVGPFYCPADQGIYLDLEFFDLLATRFGASGGPLAEMYVTAHEYAHHIQHVTGVMGRADRSGSGPQSDSVRLELQADCYAGMWAGHAAHTVDPDTGVPFLRPISEAELADALSAAAAVGDDHIQSQVGGDVAPDSWTHGSSDQRQAWFTTGYEHGTLAACDTFAAGAL